MLIAVVFLDCANLFVFQHSPLSCLLIFSKQLYVASEFLLTSLPPFVKEFLNCKNHTQAIMGFLLAFIALTTVWWNGYVFVFNLVSFVSLDENRALFLCVHYVYSVCNNALHLIKSVG